MSIKFTPNNNITIHIDCYRGMMFLELSSIEVPIKDFGVEDEYIIEQKDVTPLIKTYLTNNDVEWEFC